MNPYKFNSAGNIAQIDFIKIGKYIAGVFPDFEEFSGKENKDGGNKSLDGTYWDYSI